MSVSRSAQAFMSYYRGALDPKDGVWSTAIPSSFMLGYEAAMSDYPRPATIEVTPQKVLAEISRLKVGIADLVEETAKLDSQNRALTLEKADLTESNTELLAENIALLTESGKLKLRLLALGFEL